MLCSAVCSQAMPRNRGTSRASKSGTGVKKDQPARRIISKVKAKSEIPAEGGSSAAHALQHAEPALECWMAPRWDDPWFEQLDACEAEVREAALRLNRASVALRDLPHDEFRDATFWPWMKWSKAIDALEACYPHENVEMPCCQHCERSVFRCGCVSSLPCKVCGGERWFLFHDVPLWHPGICMCELTPSQRVLVRSSQALKEVSLMLKEEVLIDH